MLITKFYNLFKNYYIYEITDNNNNKTLEIDIPGYIPNVFEENCLFFDFINGFHNFYLENQNLFVSYWQTQQSEFLENIEIIKINAKSFGNIIASLFLIEIYKNIKSLPVLKKIEINVKGGLGVNKLLANELTKKLAYYAALNKSKNIETNIRHEINQNDPVVVYFNPFIFDINNLKTREKNSLKNIVFYLQHNVNKEQTNNNISFLQKYKNHIYNDKKTIINKSKITKNYKTGLTDILAYYKKNIEQNVYFDKNSLFSVFYIIKQFYGYNGFFNFLATVLTVQYTNVNTGIYGNINYSKNYENIIKYFYIYRTNVENYYSRNIFLQKNYFYFLIEILCNVFCVYIKVLKFFSFPYYNNNIICRILLYLCFQTFQIMQILQAFFCIIVACLLRYNTLKILQSIVISIENTEIIET